MRRSRIPFGLLVLGMCWALPVAGQGPHTPAPGSSERQAILNAARVKVAADLGHRARLLFRVDHLRVYRGWALLRAQPVTPAGTAIYKACEEADSDTTVLLQHRAGRWFVVRGGTVCTTDVYYLDWPRETGAPAEVFP